MYIRIIKASNVSHYLMKIGFVFIDIRSREEYLKGHINGAIHVPEEKLGQYFAQREKNQQYILYCQRGISSVKEAKRLQEMGFCMGTVAGGYVAYEKWKKAN